MGRKNKKGRKPRHSGGGPAPTNADWKDSTSSFRNEAEAALRSLYGGADDGAAAAERHPDSPLAHHILGHVRAALARADEAVSPLRRAAELAPRCLEIAATLATALSYARWFGEALKECARALAVADPIDPALHAAAGRGLMAASPQARVAVAREQLRGVRADAEVLMGVFHATMPPTPMTAPASRSAMTNDELRGLLTVSVEDLKAYCDQAGSTRVIAGAVEFVMTTKAWAYWLCPVCDKVFLDANSFRSHVESEYIHELQQLQRLMPRRITKESTELLDSCRWKSIDIQEEDAVRIRNLNRIKDVFSCLNEFEALSVGLVDKVVKFARGRAKKRAAASRIPHCIPCCVASLDSGDLQRLSGSLEKLLELFYRDFEWEYVKAWGDKPESADGFRIISLVQDGSILSLDGEKIASRNADGSSEVDALFNWLFRRSSPEESVVSWASMRQKCVHHGNEVLKRIDEISDLLQEQFNLKLHSQEKMRTDYFLTAADSIDVEMLRLDAEVNYLKKKLVKACTFDYSAVILPLIKAYLWAKLNSDSPGKGLHHGDDKDAAENSDNGDGSNVLNDESFVQAKTPDTDSDLNHQVSRAEEYENSSLSLSESSNLSTLETESISINSGFGIVHQITADELQFLNVILRALWHLWGFHDKFQYIPHELHYFTVGDYCIICLLCKIFCAWDNKEDHSVAIFLSYAGAAFSDILNDRNFGCKAGKNIASEIISIIFETLHMSQNSLFFDWNTGTFEHRAISTSECFDFVCLPHNLLGLHFKQKRCDCVNESCNEKEYTTIFHSVDVGAVQTTEMKSFSELLKAADKRFQYDTESCQCGIKIEHVLLYAPHFFTTVFSWPIDKESHVDMSGVLISITAPWDLRIVYECLDSESKYTLNTAVCCVEEEHLCFAREEGKWLIYESQTIESADSWESLLHRYSGKSLRPQILFFGRVRS